MIQVIGAIVAGYFFGKASTSSKPSEVEFETGLGTFLSCGPLVQTLVLKEIRKRGLSQRDFFNELRNTKMR